MAGLRKINTGKGMLRLLAFLGCFSLHSADAATVYFESGWEDGQDQGVRDRVEYSREVAGYFNSSNPPPECSPRPGETVRSGNSSLMIEAEGVGSEGDWVERRQQVGTIGRLSQPTSERLL